MDLEDGIARMQVQERNELLAFLSNDVFGNRLIVETISKKLDLADFKTFRRLRRSCYLESVPVWNNRTCVRFDSSEVTGQSLRDFNNFIVQSYGKEDNGEAAVNPFQSFSLVGWAERTDDMRTFVTLCARQIRHLEIVDYYPKKFTHEDFITTARMLTAHTESLHVRFTGESSYEETFCRQVFAVPYPNTKQLELSFADCVNLRFVFKFRNLTKLVVSDTVPSGHDWTKVHSCRASAARMLTERMRSTLALVSLNLSGTFFYCNWSNVKLFVTANFPLRHLALNFRVYEPNTDLSGILNHYGRNLVTLKLSREYSRDNPPSKFTPLDISCRNLIELSLSGNVENSLDFLKHTPVLAKLKMYQIDPEDPLFLRDAAQPLSDIVQSSRLLLGLPRFSVPSLREFRTDRMIALTSRNTLRQWMPNLQVFEVPTLDQVAG